MSVQIDGSTGNIIAIKADYSGDVSIGGTLTYEDVTNIDAVGLITARNGIKVDDLGVQVGTGATIDGATNTLTFLTNGSERLRVTSGGDVGIGTVSPTTKLHLTGNLTITKSSNNPAIIFDEHSGTDPKAKIQMDQTNSTNATLLFFTEGSGTLSERMRLDSSGKMGLGETTPLGNLHVKSGDSGASSVGASADEFVIEGSANAGMTILSGTSSEGLINFADSGDVNVGSVVYNHSDNSMRFKTADTERLRIDSSGNFGLGTSSPGEIIDVIQSAQGDAATLRIRNSADSNASTNVEIVARQASRTGGRIVFGRENANSWSSAAGYADGFISFNPTDAGSDVERMRIDSNGRLLLGFTSARANFFNGTDSPKLQLESTTFVNSAISCVRNSSNNASGGVVIGKTRGTSVGSNTIVQSGDSLGQVSFQGADGSEMVEAAKIAANIDGTPGANDMPGRLVFMTTSDGASSATERVRISENGRFSAYSDSDTVFAVRNAGTTASSAAFALYNNSTSTTTGTVKCVIRQDGDLENTNNSYGALSDVKLKENIVDAASQWDDLKAIQVRKYNFKEETGHETYTQIGVIAQEIETVSPGLISESPDLDDEGNDLGTVTKSVNYSVLYMKAVKALQEAMDRIETLETQNADLLARVTALEG